MSHLAGSPLRCLQIGAFTGDASRWLFDNVLTSPWSHLADVDTWCGSDEEQHTDFDWGEVRATYDDAVAPWRDRLQTYTMTSDEFFLKYADSRGYDFIYIDGAHTAAQVMKDGCNAIERLKPGGIVAFDDYQWGMVLPVSERPHEAIDAVTTVLADRIEVLDRGLQVWARRR